LIQHNFLIETSTEINKSYASSRTNHIYDLGDNCIVFENFTASIGDLMVAN